MNDYYLLVMFIVACALLIWEAVSYLRFKGNILVGGYMPSARIALGITGAVFIVVLVRNFGTAFWSIVTTVLFAVVLLLAMFLRCGLTENGVVIQGFLSRYSKIRYYNIDKTTAKNPRLRIGVGFQEKFLEIKPEDEQKACAYLIKNQVPSFQQYVEMKKEKKQSENK